MKRLYQEPLYLFILIGGVIFLIHALVSDSTVSDTKGQTIILDQYDIQRLGDIYARTWKTRPDSAALELLIEQEIQNEIFYREALKLNLDHNDEIVRRRLRQKYDFLIRDMMDVGEPSSEELELFLERNMDRYGSPVKLTFYQLFINPDKWDKPSERAVHIFTSVNSREWEDIDGSKYSDPIDMQVEWIDVTIDKVNLEFGMSFGDSIQVKTPKTWLKPLQSGLGWHVVYLVKVGGSSNVTLDQVKDQVLSDYQRERQERNNKLLIDNLRKQYDIVRAYSLESLSR